MDVGATVRRAALSGVTIRRAKSDALLRAFQRRVQPGAPLQQLRKKIPTTRVFNDGSGPSTQPLTPSPGLLPLPFTGDEHISLDGIDQSLLPPRREPPLQQVAWSPVVQSPVYWSSMDFDARNRLHAPEALVSHRQSLWASTSQGAISPLTPPVCGFDCATHTEAFHDALVLLNLRNELPARFIQRWQHSRTDEILTWLIQQEHIPSSPLLTCADGRTNQLAAATRRDAEMLRVFVNFISRFKASLDGEPDLAANLYIRQYVPFCLHNPMLAQIAIYTAACFLNDSCPSIVDDTTAMTRKGDAICMLETHLRTAGPTTDEAIAGVMQLILNEWYWGGRKELEAHLGGLREMVRSRGGLANLGLGGLLAKLIIMTDITIALSLEVEPHLRGDLPLESHDSVPFRVFLNTPLVSPLVPFKACAEPLKLHEATARILDDIRFLIGLVLALPADCSQKDLQKLQSTSTWIYDHILGLPEELAENSQHRGSEDPPPSLSTIGASGSPPSVRGASSAANPRGVPEPNAPGFLYTHKQHSPLNQRDMFPGGMSDHPARVPQSLLADLEDTTSPTAADVIYQAVRQAALIYARAIMLRRPLRDQRVCPAEDFLRLWTTVWRAPLRAWKALLGVFVWVVLCVTPSSRGTPHERLVKNCLEIGLVQMGLESWEVAEKGMEGALRLMRWLACRDGGIEVGELDEGHDAE
ncbi:hypothetical protein diail_9241 [Diaporthe ilicicola]|nr:hypothetical protein diail_9241 [Diaporthe ilicicola]